MGRVIKFRGLNAYGEFVYGLPSADTPNSTHYYSEYSYRICWLPETGGCANQPIKNGTLGQFTGLLDRNGVEIYESDFVSDHVGVGLVCYSEKHAAFRVIYGDGLAKWFYDYNLKGEFESIEVIGNTHQSKELLNHG
jgi:hypothetical protein